MNVKKVDSLNPIERVQYLRKCVKINSSVAFYDEIVLLNRIWCKQNAQVCIINF